MTLRLVAGGITLAAIVALGLKLNHDSNKPASAAGSSSTSSSSTEALAGSQLVVGQQPEQGKIAVAAASGQKIVIPLELEQAAELALSAAAGEVGRTPPGATDVVASPFPKFPTYVSGADKDYVFKQQFMSGEYQVHMTFGDAKAWVLAEPAKKL